MLRVVELRILRDPIYLFIPSYHWHRLFWWHEMFSLFYKRWCWQPQELESAWRLISELNTAWLSCVSGGGGNVFVVVLLVWVADGVCTLDGTHRCVVHDFVVCYSFLWRRVSHLTLFNFNVVSTLSRYWMFYVLYGLTFVFVLMWNECREAAWLPCGPVESPFDCEWMFQDSLHGVSKCASVCKAVSCFLVIRFA